MGLDINAAVLVMKKRPNGHEMTAYGSPVTPAKVRFENTTISGPDVNIDQPNNRVAVKGAGWLKMPSSSGLGGTAVAGRSELTVHWQTQMNFRGEQQSAFFLGQVQAVQDLVHVLEAVDADSRRIGIADLGCQVRRHQQRALAVLVVPELVAKPADLTRHWSPAGSAGASPAAAAPRRS